MTAVYILCGIVAILALIIAFYPIKDERGDK